MKKKQFTLLRILFLTLYLSYYAGGTLFPHTHTFNGVTITHSHPYLPSGHHNHSATSYYTIDSLSHLLFVVPIAAFAFIAPSFSLQRNKPTAQPYYAYAANNIQLRAPPID